ncbi:MAG TPA: tRNA uridine-5-carboxymethylaminomethyl(34) synthesis GTPase MnmE [Pyrinomonadaceae bacterium]|nr:tRNA uridine-5-carboxymethylaminomethyl(34) synthesis GTPase MnmE [Pyrinomonadaceae bacterium]
MDTIVAVATSAGRSAIGVIRLSGPQSLVILRRLLAQESFIPAPRYASLKQIFRESGEPLDSALITYFEAPHSFTGEDMAEISCHGSPVVLRNVLDLTLRFGARLAEAGEFSLRACKHGKMNLSQAEAIRDLIAAQTDAAATHAARQLNGELSSALQPVKDKLISVIVKLESALEFVEDDLPELDVARTRNQLQEIAELFDGMARTYAAGRMLREGLKVTLVGRPNVGKSSLFNRLLGLDRAIVTDIAGTTRDTITHDLSLQGVPVSLTDTAGIRSAGDKIEEFGVERTQRAMVEADMLVVVVDGSTELHAEDHSVLKAARSGRHVVAINKSDLDQVPGPMNGLPHVPNAIHVSALTGAGLEELTTAILEPFGAVDSESVGLLITDSRHYDLLRRSQSSLDDSVIAFGLKRSEELVLVGLHNALLYLGEITGETTADEILGQIFSTFCIGK